MCEAQARARVAAIRAEFPGCDGAVMIDANLPKGRSLADEYAKTLSAQLGIAPSLFASEAQFQPQYTGLALSNFEHLLGGTPEYSYDTQSYVPAVYKQGGKYSYGKIPAGVQGTIAYPSLPDSRGGGGGSSGGGLPGMGGGLPGMGGGGLPGMGGGLPIPGMDGGLPGLPGMGGGGGFPIPGLGGLFGGDDGPKKKLLSPSRYETTSHTMAAQRGLIDILGTYAPELIGQFRNANPGAAGLMDQMNQQASEELGLGTALDPTQNRIAEQAVRAGQASRGMGYGPSDVYTEALTKSAFGEDLRNQRRQFAGNVVGMDQNIYGNLFASLLSMGLSPGQAGTGGPRLFNTESPYAQDIYNTNFNAAASSAIANANNRNALIGAGISAIGNIGGGALGALGACWVAREVYGELNPRWLQFRDWLWTAAPVWFRCAYVKYGAKFADWLHNKPRVKALVRLWMDSRIEGK